MARRRRGGGGFGGRQAAFLVGAGVVGYLIYTRFLRKEPTRAIPISPTRPALPVTGDTALPGGMFAPQVMIPGIDDQPVIMPAPATTEVGAPGSSTTFGVTDEELTEIPGIAAKVQDWNCNKLKQMRRTYRGLARKDKKADTRKRADIAARYIDATMQVRCVGSSI